MDLKRRVAAPNQTPANEASEKAAEPPAVARQPDRRREPRYQTNDPVEVEYSASGLVHLSASVRDVSRTGLRLELNRAIGRGMQIRVTFPGKLAIFGEVRYCRPAGGGFHIGLLIQDMVRSSGAPERHIHDDELSLYLVGKGLTVPEVFALREHLVKCEECQVRLNETNAILNPAPRRKG